MAHRILFRGILLTGLGLLLSASGCTHQVKLISGITSVVLQKQQPSTRQGLAKEVKVEFYGAGKNSSQLSNFPNAKSLESVKAGIARALKLKPAEVRVLAFKGDPTEGFESAIESDDQSCVTYYISDIGLLINKSDRSIYRVSIGYQALTELQGDASSDENLAKLADAVTDSIRYAIVEAARRDNWKLAQAERKREEKRKSYFPFGPDQIIAGPAPRPDPAPKSKPVKKTPEIAGPQRK